jgi:hypothetical protein
MLGLRSIMSFKALCDGEISTVITCSVVVVGLLYRSYSHDNQIEVNLQCHKSSPLKHHWLGRSRLCCTSPPHWIACANHNNRDWLEIRPLIFPLTVAGY